MIIKIKGLLFLLPKACILSRHLRDLSPLPVPLQRRIRLVCELKPSLAKRLVLPVNVEEGVLCKVCLLLVRKMSSGFRNSPVVYGQCCAPKLECLLRCSSLKTRFFRVPGHPFLHPFPFPLPFINILSGAVR